ncbi:N-acetylmuramoyl-L-alanine amidase [Robertmurraya andreesenii]|uniref:N-acetylmuramoyl-L-alanine amidase n=1 Tax=Anoxybacillus andreesenii TaxID=1325932 RepID=A0ABT9V1R5_9BACL|nr:N-acetylmuramoyl-L-alanine amidase [Robertmurraya andreesenii]MDQ0154899.1 N-acetylmuramoyl-L-alanine amidase [Robertmurraya andreesenii]
MTYSVVTVNAGHSAKAPGASGNGYREHEVARTLKDKLIKALNAVGQKTADTTSDAGDKNAVLAEQVRKCNAVIKNGRLDVAIHLNAGGGTGTEVLHFGASTKALAAKVSAAIAKAGGYRDRGAKQRQDLYFLRNTNAPSILIEVCFIDNADDMRKLMAQMDAIVNAIVKAITGKVAPAPAKPKSAYEIELEQAVDWAKAAGVSDGTRLNDACTRGQVIMMLYRLSKGAVK